MASHIRNEGLDTAVWGDCLSACTYAFMGGINRYMNLSANMGFHPSWAPTSDNQLTLSELSDIAQHDAVDTVAKFVWYAYDGEVDITYTTEFLSKVYSETWSHGMYYATPNELLQANIVTETYGS